MIERAYYLSWSSRWREPVRACASRQDEWAGPFTALLELDVRDIGGRARDFQAAILEDHLGRRPRREELAAFPHGLRITADELQRALAPTRQLTLFGARA